MNGQEGLSGFEKRFYSGEAPISTEVPPVDTVISGPANTTHQKALETATPEEEEAQ
jgi:hypothetical protein